MAKKKTKQPTKKKPDKRRPSVTATVQITKCVIDANGGDLTFAGFNFDETGTWLIAKWIRDSEALDMAIAGLDTHIVTIHKAITAAGGEELKFGRLAFSPSEYMKIAGLIREAGALEITLQPAQPELPFEEK